MKASVLIALGVCSVLCDVTSSGFRLTSRPLCGEQLLEALGTVCNHKFNTPTDLKRSYLDKTSSFSLDGVIPSKRNNEADIYYKHTQTRGIVDECCVKSCTLTQLRRYCDDDVTAELDEVPNPDMEVFQAPVRPDRIGHGGSKDSGTQGSRVGQVSQSNQGFFYLPKPHQRTTDF